MKTITQYHARRAAARAIRLSALLLSSAVLLAACGGDGGDAPPKNANESDRQSLLYAYPDNGQTEVATPSPIVLRFTSAVAAVDAEAAITLHQGDENGPALPFTAEPVPDEPRGIVLTPESDLAPLADYTVTIRDLRLAKGTAADQDLHFTTRALQRGPRSLVIADEAFKVSRTLPNDTAAEPVMDFSTFRFQFTQPIDATTARYGQGTADTVNLVDSIGNLVDAIVLVDGPYLTVDPKPEYLTAGETYTLTLGGGLTSTYGATFASTMISFTPRDSSPRGEPAILVQRITDSENRTNTSLLTGEPVNEVPVNATLLGENSATQTSGDVLAELADVTIYPDVTPVRIPRDTILTGSNIDVMIGGEVPAGISSGEVKMHFLSDATGYLVPNPYNNVRDDALRIVHLFMDVAISTEEAEANGGFTQDILHIELVGVAEVDPDAGVLNIDAVSMVEPDVLGQEFAHGLLSFQLQSYPDQVNPPDNIVPDTVAPTLQSWTLGIDGATGLDKTLAMKPTDPIILNFDEPLDRQSIVGKVHLYRNEGGAQTEEPIKAHMDGAALVINPEQPFQHPTETGPGLTYTVRLDPGITDLSGNAWADTFSETFASSTLVEERRRYQWQVFPVGFNDTGEITPVQEKSTFVLALYPGFPCPLNTTTRDLANGLAGRCIGGMQPHPNDDLGTLGPLTPDDILPVPDMPADRPIIAVFSEAIDPASLFDDQGGTPTFQVYEIDPQTPDTMGAPIAGTVTLDNDTLHFIPDQPWQDGQLYGYTLKSNGDMTSSTGQCDASLPDATLCGLDGLPLQTQLLSVVSTRDYGDGPTGALVPIFSDYFIWQESAPDFAGGGQDITQYFQGAPASKAVLQLLRMADNIDSNNNLINDSTPALDSPQDYMFGPPGDLSTGLSFNFATFYGYDINETDGVDWQPDSSTASLVDSTYGLPIDPSGVKSPPNSAKILSSFYGYDAIDQFPDATPEHPYMDRIKTSTTGSSVGANVGCGWESFPVFEDQTDCDQYGEGFFGKKCYYGVPAECPKDKFTYLHGALFAEVTNEMTPDGDLMVHIFPGHVITTSFTVYTKNPTGSRSEVIDSGFQTMRMRYPQGEKVIDGFIQEGSNGPELTASLDLYLDAPFLVEDITNRKNIIASMHHNFYSYPVSMSLSGPVSFLEDGRMLVEQHNDNVLELHLRANTPITMVDFMIPKDGTFLRYISQPIK
jgi:hypothetical protein